MSEIFECDNIEDLTDWMAKQAKKETYLGHGLYVSFDGYMIKLRAPIGEGNHEVYLEPPVLDAFMEFIRNLRSD
jgi:hypothetical protein